MSSPPLYKSVELFLYSKGQMQKVSCPVVTDKPLTIFYNDTELTTLICSPGNYELLVVGFLVSEGMLQAPSDIKEITCLEEEGILRVQTNSSVPDTEKHLRRNMSGYYGEELAALYFTNDVQDLRPVKSTCRYAAQYLLQMIGLLDEKSAAYRLTGGVHSAALADGSGMLVMYEDIGRHNAVDKVLGHAFLKRFRTEDMFLLLSGRISSEILIKAARSGLPLVVSRSAPTELAVELASQLNITVVGFARGQQLSIYSHPERVTL